MNRLTSIASQLKPLSWAAAAAIACGLALPAAQAATVTLTNTTGNSCTYTSASTDASGNTTFVCQSGTVEPPPPPPPPPDGSALCTLAASPVKSPYLVGDTVTFSGTCQNAVGVLLVNGALVPDQVGTSITYTTTLQTKGSFAYEFIGTNNVNQHIARVDISVADPNDTAPPPVGNCPVASTVGPRAGFTDLGNLRFDLKPGEIGSQPFAFPNAGRRQLKVGTIFGTTSETPYGTDVQVSISECPGQFTNLPAGCIGNFSRNGGSVYIGDTTECTLEDDKTYYVNLRHVKYLSNPPVNSCVAPPFGYCTHYTRFNSF